MPNEAATTDTEATTEAVEPESTTETEPDGSEALGDAGKRALDHMKAERDAAIKALRAAESGQDAVKAARQSAQELTDLRRFKAEAEGRLADFEAEQAKAEAERTARAEADQRFNERILRAEIKAAAKGRLSDPEDAFRFLDASVFEVSEDGDPDTSAIESAIEALLESKPYLAVQDGRRFTGTPDAGARKETGPPQLTEQDLKGMSPDQIVEAKKSGQLNTLLGIKTP